MTPASGGAAYARTPDGDSERVGLAHVTVADDAGSRFDGPVFNALRSDELLLGIAQVLRMAADRREALEEYERSQLLSAFSVSRLLAAEQRAAAELLTRTQAELDAVLAEPADGPAAAARSAVGPARDARARVAAATTGVEVGDALADLLAELPADDPLRAPVRRVLRTLADCEVNALAAVA